MVSYCNLEVLEIAFRHVQVSGAPVLSKKKERYLDNVIKTA